jgi:polysaccharide biosynthesis/export protein
MRAFSFLPRLVVALVIPFLVTNCTTNTNQASTAVAPGTAATALASANAAAADYKISPHDILEVSVFQVADLNKTVQVSDDGNIMLPLIGQLRVASKTTQEAAQMIADKLGKKYLQSPQVSIFVKQYGQRVTVNGEVKNPRVLTVEGTLTLSQTIAYAGGFTDLANDKRVHVARATNGHVQDKVYNIDAIQAGHAPDPQLQGGDLVVVEQSGAKVVIKNLKDMLPFAVLASVI